MENNNTINFLTKYFENLTNAVADGSIRLESLSILCEFCPLRDKCREDEDNGDHQISCENYIRQNGGAC